MRVLLLSQFFFPRIGGEEIHVLNLGRELVSRGHEVSVATLDHPGMPAFEIIDGMRIHRIQGAAQHVSWLFSDPNRRLVPPVPDPMIVAALARIVDVEQPQVAHAHNWIVHSFLPLRATRQIPLVLSLHDCSMVCSRKDYLYRGSICDGPGFEKCLRCTAAHYGTAKGLITTAANWVSGGAERMLVDRFLPVSDAVARCSRLSAGNLPFEVIPNFVPDSLADATAGNSDGYAGQLPAEPYLLFVGAFNRAKGLDILLKAYRRLEPHPPLVVIGYSVGETEAVFGAAPCEGVVRLEEWPRHAVMEAWRRSMIGVIPSVVLDSSPTVAMEAMATGVPVIASRVGGLPDLVADGETGLLTDPGNVDELRAALQQLVNDPSQRLRLGRAARERFPLFQASTVIPRIERVYEQVLGR